MTENVEKENQQSQSRFLNRFKKMDKCLAKLIRKREIAWINTKRISFIY